ncbi:hypothetical protein BCR41DRAFT_348044 [Lobosporangium transversale]|uniref:Uncharacterized protein n=1 Tax=Lobosporangium transversale TaxID=64571 RepID=A0A1Y2GVF9_9FUNG|nr:hypothetical protein BCR41DRAFT_348044 [Lobosporangium transversale]ORZ26280.1 hypothetical protein BCR41DRAFT_348044 [Lobosporangium transversale]|eukprot:XP_021884045.1 hypothetical protein BCR41DRAFT_348044 [Lobosporangium transversale]
MDDILPSSGEEYLRMVRAQAKSFPVVVVAPQAQEYLSTKNTSLKYKTDWNSCRPAPEGCAPIKEWKENFMKEFELERARLKKYKSLLAQRNRFDKRNASSSKSCSDQEQRTQSIPLLIMASHDTPLPHMFDEQQWRVLLYGATRVPTVAAAAATPVTVDTSVVTVPNEVDIKESTFLSDTTVSIENATTMTATASFPTEEEEPSLQQDVKLAPQDASISDVVPVAAAAELRPLVESLSQPLASPSLLPLPLPIPVPATSKLTKAQGMMPHPLFLGKWLYALFLKLDPLLESDQVSILRSMAKKCARIRSHLNVSIHLNACVRNHLASI